MLKGHLHQARTNLTSSASQNTLVKLLDERTKDFTSIPWNNVIEQLRVKVLEAYRRGEPVVTLADLEPTQGLGFRIAPILREGVPTIFYGDGESAKSLFAKVCASMVASGVGQLGFDPIPGSVLYCDYEIGDSEDAREDFQMIANGLGADLSPNLHYLYMQSSIAASQERLQAEVLDKAIDLLVIDSGGPAVNGEPESSEATLKLFTALRPLKVTTLIIAHETKKSAKSKTDEGPFGSSMWKNMARSTYRMKATREPGTNTTTFSLTHRKQNKGQRLKPMFFSATFTSDAITFGKASSRGNSVLDSERSLKDRVFDVLLHDGAMTAQDLGRRLDADDVTIRARLNDGKGKLFTITNPDVKPAVWGVMARG